MPPAQRTEKVPIYRYTITLKDGLGERSALAMGYQLDGGWMVFDDTNATVLAIREDLVSEVARGEQTGEQEVDAL